MNISNKTNFDSLTISEIRAFAKALKNETYFFSAENAKQVFLPQGIYSFQLKKSYYSAILGDKKGYFKTILISFYKNPGQLVRFPIGLFGVSPQNKIRFPIIIGQTISSFIKIEKTDFLQLLKYNRKSFKLKDDTWQILFLVKRKLIERIFEFYTQLEGGKSSIMAWKSRNKTSITRQIVEKIPGYVREEDPHLDTEYYFNKNLTKKTRSYIKNCAKKWYDAKKWQENTSPKEDNVKKNRSTNASDNKRNSIVKKYHIFFMVLVESQLSSI